MSIEEGPASPPASHLSSTELERVIRRAAELQTLGETLPDRLDDEELMRIGAEVGLQEQHLRRALVEVRAEALVAGPSDEPSLPGRLWGAAFVQANRVVSGEVSDLQSRLDEYLTTGEMLKQVRSRAGFSVWEPASDLVSQIRRGFDITGHGYVLTRARQIEVAIQGLEPGRCLVTLSADVRNRRAGIGGGLLGAAAGVTGATTLVLAAGFLMPVLPVALSVGVAATGGATLLTRRINRSERDRMSLALEGLLDRLERRDRIGSRRPDVIDRIQGLIAESDR